MERQALLDRARHRGVNPLVYWLARAVLQPFFHLYFRLSRIGREHIPQQGGVILAANHRSFLDPFVIGCMVRRPCYFVAKKELFENRLTGWVLNALGAFPIDRGNADGDAMATARAILERGDVVVIFPEGTRTRPGGIGRAKRGVGRLALETGVPVVPVAVLGTDDIRDRWRIRPDKVRVRAGRPLRFPRVENPSAQLAGAVTDRLWPMVALQWEWLGGAPPIRRVAIVGAGARGTELAAALGGTGAEVALGWRSSEESQALRGAGESRRLVSGVALPTDLSVVPARDLDLAAADLVVLAVPARSLPAALGAHGDRIGPAAAVLVLSDGLVAPMGTLPAQFVAERLSAHRVATLAGPALAAGVLVASRDGALTAWIAELFGRAGLPVQRSTDVTGAELAALAADAAAVAGATAAPLGPVAAGAAGGRVYAEVSTLALRLGAQPETFTGPAGAGALIAAAEMPRDERATAGGVDALGLLAYAMREHRVAAPATEGLAAVVDGRAEARAWAAALAAPRSLRRAA